jgi:hypothetical protein
MCEEEQLDIFPELYKDVDEFNSSSSHDRDLVNVMNLISNEEYHEELTAQAIDAIEDGLSEDIRTQIDQIRFGDIEHPKVRTDFMSGTYVGDIHYIPKAGSGYRPIAVPNRFVQKALKPCYLHLSSILRALPRDCTYNQDRFDSGIISRVNSDGFFISSVDLSAATENLPLAWAEYFVKIFRLTTDQQTSWDLFLEIAKSPWNNEGFMSKWRVGQPLEVYLPSRY